MKRATNQAFRNTNEYRRGEQHMTIKINYKHMKQNRFLNSFSKTLGLIIFLFSIAFSVSAQNQDSLKLNENQVKETDTLENKFIPNLLFKIGLSNYRGDIGFIQNVGSLGNALPSFTLGVNYEFYKFIGLDIYGSYLGLTQSEKSVVRNHNFKTVLFGGGVDLKFLLANDFILPTTSNIKPYVFGGFNFYSFNQKTDLLDGNGGAYNYWSDGSIRDLPENEINVATAKEISRDFDYESEINNVESSALGFSLGFGAYFTVNDFISASFDAAYNGFLNDAVDGIVAGEGNDGYFNLSIGAHFNLNKFKKRTSKKSDFYDDVNFDAILAQDFDADGVLDLDDKCNDTPQDAKVGADGCPIDSDKDGVPDYKDEEIQSKSGAKVDELGKAIADSLLTNEASDTLVTLRSELCEFYPSMCKYSELDAQYQILNTGSADNITINSKGKLPIEEVVELSDQNKNGKIEVKEIYNTIDLFFMGESKMQMHDIHQLIDYFFSQKK